MPHGLDLQRQVENPGRFPLYPGLSAAAGIVILWSLVSFVRSGEDTGVRLAPFVDAIMEIKIHAGEAHLAMEEIIAGDKTLNEMLQSISDGIGATIGVMSAVARGDLRRKMSGDFKGSFGNMQDSINATLDELTRITTSLSDMSRELASEVRAQAQRANVAASGIGDLIEESGRGVEEGVRLITHTGEVLREILRSISQVAEFSAKIAESSREQSNGISEVSAVFADLDRLTQQNATMAEEGTVRVRNLRDRTQGLEMMIDFFSTAGGEGRVPPRVAS